MDYFIQIIKIASKALLANKGRSFLTMLGIIIGVGAVIIIMAVGAGAQSLVLNQVKSLGSNLIGILPGGSDGDGPPAAAMGIVITTLKYEDALALGEKNNVPNLLSFVAYTKGVGTVSYGANSYDTNLSGATHGYVETEGGEILEGRFFTEEEEKNMSRGVVLGYSVKKELFGNSSALGQKVRIKKHSFDVIGVMAERGTVAMQDYDDQVFIPLKTMQKLIAGVNHLGIIRAKIDQEENTTRAIEDIKITLRERHDIRDDSGESDDFSVQSAAAALDMLTSITDALKYFLAAMAALSLVVGGIGIMNIMLVAVSERTREIGLRKAVGANNANIMGQFLIESIFITSLGGFIGMIAGFTVSYLVFLGANYLGYDWAFVVSPFSIILAVVISAVIGLIFGLFPARKASRLEPVEALRYE